MVFVERYPAPEHGGNGQLQAGGSVETLVQVTDCQTIPHHDGEPPARGPMIEVVRTTAAATGSLASARSRGRHERVTCLALSAALAVIAVTCKILLLPFPVSTVGQFVRWVLRLAIVVSPDICFVTGAAVVAWSSCAALRRWPGVVRWAWNPLCYGGFALAAVYAVASVPMFKVTMVPFTIQLLSYAGGPGVLSSSVKPFLPLELVALLIATPLAVMLAPLALRRAPWFRQGAPLATPWLLAALVLIAAYGAVCRQYIQANWTDPNRWERRIAQSPHGVLLYSCLEEALKDQRFSRTYTFAEIDDSDFRQARAATGQVVSVANLLFTGAQRPKNVIVILMESIGVEYFGVQGSKYPTTPHLDRLAAEQGLVFDSLYTQAASSCKSIVALSASVYDRPDWLLIVRDHPEFDVPTITQVLDRRGYRTCFAHSGYWSWQNRDRFLRDRGVDKIIDAEGRPDELVNSWGIHDQTMFEDVLRWIDEAPNEPFFALAYTIETHHPYVAPQKLHDFGVKDEELSRYLNAIRATDERISWLVRELERRGLAESTVLAITADHGESFGQHNQRVHSFGIYEPTVHVPLVLLHPSLRGQARHVPDVARMIDVAPTLLDLLGVPAPKPWQGQSLLRPHPPLRAYFLSVGNEVVLGLRDGKFKYHYYVDTGREELFDLSRDRQELTNLATKHRKRCAEYRSRLGGLVTYQRDFLAQHGVR